VGYWAPEKVKAYNRAYYKRNREKIKAQTKAYRAANPDWARDYNSAYYQRTKETHRRNQAAWEVANPERAREIRLGIRERYRARKASAFVEAVDAGLLYQRDEGICGICGKPVEHWRFEIDHIIPLSKGGEHSYANTQIAHGRCNRSKGNRVSNGD
jgi:5-methylcytosine-specific restriction endonuclease McrA